MGQFRPGVTEEAQGDTASTWTPVDIDDTDSTTDELDAMVDEDASLFPDGV